MSAKMPYYSIDKVAATISIDAKARVKWDKKAKDSGKKVTTLMAEYLEQIVRDDPFTVEDQRRANEYMNKNAENREKRMMKKGVHK